MRLSVDFPRISPAIESGTVAVWHKQPGDAVAYGDDLFDIAIDEVTRMQRRLGARMRKPAKTKYRKLSGVSVVYRVTSMDSGTMGEIVAPAGSPISVGDVVGFIDAGGDDPDGVAPARTTFNLVGSEASA